LVDDTSLHGKAFLASLLPSFLDTVDQLRSQGDWINVAMLTYATESVPWLNFSSTQLALDEQLGRAAAAYSEPYGPASAVLNMDGGGDVVGTLQAFASADILARQPARDRSVPLLFR
jgi:hypothetical protein